jgi:hypothetical protein
VFDYVGYMESLNLSFIFNNSVGQEIEMLLLKMEAAGSSEEFAHQGATEDRKGVSGREGRARGHSRDRDTYGVRVWPGWNRPRTGPVVRSL